MKASQHLIDNVDRIVHVIESGQIDDNQEGDVFDFIDDVLDIRFILNSKREYVGAELCVAFGGPTIWVDLVNRQVKGYWWDEQWVRSYDHDNLGLEDVVSDLYHA